MADLTSVAAMLKEVWPQRMETAFSNEIVALARIEQTSEGIYQDPGGRYAVVPLHTGRNVTGIGSRAERGVLPTPGNQQYKAARVAIKHQYGTGDITSQALLLAESDPQSFISTIDGEMSGLKDDVMKDYARQVYGDGAGTLATQTASPSGNDLTVDRVQYLQVGQLVDSVTASTDTVTATGMEITAIDEDTKVVTVDDATGALSGDILVLTGNYNQEISGLDALLDSDHASVTFQNLTSASEPTWKPLISSPSAHAYSEVEIMYLLDRVRRSSGKQTTAMFMHMGIRRAIFAGLQQDRQTVNSVEFAQGFSALPFNFGAVTIPQVEDPDFPGDFDVTSASIYGIHEPTVKLYGHESGWHFAEETGSMFYPSTDRSDTFEFRMRKFSQMGYLQRNAHWRLDNVNTVSA